MFEKKLLRDLLEQAQSALNTVGHNNDVDLVKRRDVSHQIAVARLELDSSGHLVSDKSDRHGRERGRGRGESDEQESGESIPGEISVLSVSHLSPAWVCMSVCMSFRRSVSPMAIGASHPD